MGERTIDKKADTRLTEFSFVNPSAPADHGGSSQGISQKIAKADLRHNSDCNALVPEAQAAGDGGAWKNLRESERRAQHDEMPVTKDFKATLKFAPIYGNFARSSRSDAKAHKDSGDSPIESLFAVGRLLNMTPSRSPRMFHFLTSARIPRTKMRSSRPAVRDRAKALLTLIAMCFAETSQAAVWDATEQWSSAWETRFQQWVESDWNKDIFVGPGPLQGVKLDCADAVYMMRMYFSYLHKLPFAMKDSTSSRGQLVTQSMTRWDHLPEAQRVRQFAFLIFNIGSTASLPQDTYPVAVNRQALASGSLLLTDRSSHHSWTIKYFSNTGIPFLVFASRPARTLMYERFEYPTFGFTFPNGLRPETNAGFRAFRQPSDILKPVHQVPGFSLEQYSIAPATWARTLQRRMQTTQETAEQKVTRIYNEACRAARERVEAVRDGVAYNARIGSRCMNSTEYDDYSTPSRDKRLQGTFDDLMQAFQEAGAAQPGSGLSQRLRDQFALMQNSLQPNLGTDACPVEIRPGQSLTLGQVYRSSVAQRLSNNPHDTLEMRWGIQAGPSAKAANCPVY